MPDHPNSIDRRRFLAGATAATAGLLTFGCSLGDRSSSDPSDDEVFPRGLMASWWSVPRAVEVQGRTWATGLSPLVVEGYGPDVTPISATARLPVVDPGGLVSAVELGRSQRHDFDIRQTDDHATPAFLMETDLPPLVFLTDRALPPHLPYQRGRTPLDLDDLEPLTQIDFSAEGGEVCYAQPHRTPGTETVTVISRTGIDAWSVAVSPDWGDTWTTRRVLQFTGSRGYVLSVRDGDLLRCAAYGHPARQDPEIRSFTIDLTTGELVAAGSVVGNLDGTDLPIEATALPVTWAPPPGHRTRLFDVSSTGEILFAVWPDTDPDAGQFRHIHLEGERWIETDLGPTGARFGGHPPANYLGGGSFPNPSDGTVWLSRCDNAGEWTWPEKRTGDTWTIEHWSRDGSSWTHLETAASDSVPLIRPYCPIGATDGPPVVWHRVELYGASFIWLNDSMRWPQPT